MFWFNSDNSMDIVAKGHMTDTQVELTWCGVDLAARVEPHEDLLLQPLHGRLLLIQPPLPLHQLLRILTTPTQDLFSLGQVPTAYTTC